VVPAGLCSIRRLEGGVLSPRRRPPHPFPSRPFRNPSAALCEAFPPPPRSAPDPGNRRPASGGWTSSWPAPAARLVCALGANAGYSGRGPWRPHSRCGSRGLGRRASLLWLSELVRDSVKLTESLQRP